MFFHARHCGLAPQSPGIEREKQLKNWKRAWKNELVEKENPEWKELSLLGDCGSSPQ
ncbi:MAG: hypothetical protein LBU70_00355 [Chitinispirillales bacterium]|nr:hypothetical protein [Chitinispirillales bacterium]